MKITTKINVMTTLWILCVLVVVNAIVFFSFMQITLNIEKDNLIQKGQQVIKELTKVENSTHLKERLSPYLINQSFIRVIDANGNVIEQLTNDQVLADKVIARYSQNLVVKRHTIHINNHEEQVIVARIPIKDTENIGRTLEIGEKVTGLEFGKDILLSILIFSTLLGSGFALIGGRWFARIIMKPIRNMINTMEDIESSGVIKKIMIQDETNDELQKMTTTFNKMIGRLDENLERQKQFISDASHELKTPLTIIMSYADLLRRRGIQNEEMTLEAIESIYVEASHMKKMTETFLELANTEMLEVLEMKKIDVIHLCQDIIKQLKGVYSREINLHYDRKKQVAIKGDELKLKQVIIILLDNAIKYSTDKIDIYLEDHDRFVKIRIRDYGIGIPESEIQHIFERFYRVDKARSRETGGTGLGLSIAKNIMNLHSGEIKVRSVEGEGTEVELRIPHRQEKG